MRVTRWRSNLDRGGPRGQGEKVETTCAPRVRLLVIDDDPDIWEVVRAVSSEHPVLDVVATAATPEEGLAITRQSEPDAILLDHHFESEHGKGELAPDASRAPRGLSGLEAVEFLRASAPNSVIALYSGVPGLHESAEHAGADVYVQKGPDLRGVLDDLAARAIEKRSTAPH